MMLRGVILCLGFTVTPLMAIAHMLGSRLTCYHYSENGLGGLVIQQIITSYDKQGKSLIQSPSQTREQVIDTDNGNTLSRMDAASNRISFAYDALGRKIDVRYQNVGVAEVVQRLSYQIGQQGTSVTIDYPRDVEGQTYQKTWQYDALGREVAINDDSGQGMRYLQRTKYNDLGGVASQLDVDNQQQRFFYDAQGRQTKRQQANHWADITHYDDVNNRISQYRQAINQRNLRTATRTRQLDNNQQVTQQWLDNDLGQTPLFMQRNVDNFGEVINEATAHDGKQQQSNNRYNALGQVVTSQLSAETGNEKSLHLRLSYDLMGKLVARQTTDEQGKVHGYQLTYDGLGQRLSKQYPLGRAQTYTYFPRQQQRQLNDFSGQKIVDTYQRTLNQEQNIKTSYPATDNYPSFTEQANYDPATGQLISRYVNDKQDRVTYQYQADGKLRCKTYVASHKSICYRYKANGDLLEKTDAFGWHTTYQYDQVHHLTQLTWLDDHGHQHYQVNQTYNALGQLTNKWAINAASSIVSNTTYQYNHLGQLVRMASQQTDTNKVIKTYDYDNGGNIKQTTESLFNHGQQWHYESDYHYDNADRLNEEIETKTIGRDYQSSKLVYDYDANGNLTAQTKTKLLGGTNGFGIIPSVQHSYQFNALDQLLSIDQKKPQISYDANGNTWQDEAHNRYYYNSKKQLMKYVSGKTGTITDYTYYPSGLRKSQRQNDTTLTYYYDGQQLINTEDNQGKHSSYLFGLQREARSLTDAKDKILQTLSYAYNQQGSVTAVLRGHTVGYHHYDSNGNDSTPLQARLSLQQNPFKYRGEQQDANGLVYLRARYYKPNLLETDQLGQGRFLSRDSYDKINSYRYADNNSIMKVDPSGHSAKQALQGVNAAISSLFLLASVSELPFLRWSTGSMKTIGLGNFTGAALTVTSNVLQLVSIFSRQEKLRQRAAYLALAFGCVGYLLNVINSVMVSRPLYQAEKEINRTSQSMGRISNVDNTAEGIEMKDMARARSNTKEENFRMKALKKSSVILTAPEQTERSFSTLWNPRIFARRSIYDARWKPTAYFIRMKWFFRAKTIFYGTGFVHLWVKASIADHLFNS